MSKWENVELAKRLDNCSDIRRVSDVEFEEVVSKLAACMGQKVTDRRWWWENTDVQPFAFNYGENFDFYLGLLTEAKALESDVYLFVSAELTPPWPCYQATVKRLSLEIAEAPLTEFIIMGSDFRWSIVDNHHNQLLLFGNFEINTDAN